MRIPTLALLAFIAAGAASSGTMAVEAWRALRSEAAKDPIGIAESRLEPIRKHIPEGVTLGYVGDFAYPAPLADVEQSIAFYWTQYALAPVPIVRNPAPEYLIGNFLEPGSLETMKAHESLTLVHDAGNGVALFRREMDH